MKRQSTILALVASLLLLSFQGVDAQKKPCSLGTSYRGCRACGSAKSPAGQILNVQKNRSRKATNVQTITIDDLRDPDKNNDFRPSMRVQLTGYVAKVGYGGKKEGCNCNRDDLRDIHIDVVASPDEVGDPTKGVVVEISPRWQKRFGMDDSDYEQMLDTLREEIGEKWVTFEGWMLYDTFHVKESETTAPGKTGNWRATPWEVHPVTSYTVLAGPPQ